MGKKIEEIEGSAIEMHIQSTYDILLKWADIRNSFIPPNWDDMRSKFGYAVLYAIRYIVRKNRRS